MKTDNNSLMYSLNQEEHYYSAVWRVIHSFYTIFSRLFNITATISNVAMVTTGKSPTPITNKPNGLVLFNEIWYQIFLYCLATTLLMYLLAACISIRSLHKHRFGRYIPIVLVLVGFLYPLTGGVITSAFIAWIYSAAGYVMATHYAFVYGAGQAVFLLLTSFIRLYGTL